jgi:hypothetical protein
MTASFSDDRGEADPDVAAALDALARGTGSLVELQCALVTARVLSAVVAAPLAESSQSEQPSSPGRHGAEMSTVTITGRDGRRALPIFSSLAAMAAWNPAARPFPLPAPDAARGALDEGAVAVIVDVAGPHAAAIEGTLLEALADGVAWTPSAEDERVVVAISAALAGLAVVSTVGVAPSTSADLSLTVAVSTDTDAATAAAAEVVQERLRAAGFPDPLLPGGLDLIVTSER